MAQLLPTAHYRVSYVLLALLAAGVLWATLGSVDIVVQAQGKLVPTTFVKVSQPAEAGPLAELLVVDGQAVTRGQILARLDAVQVFNDSKAEQAEVARLNLVLRAQEALMSNSPLPSHDGTPAQRVVIEEHVIRRQAQNFALAQASAATVKARHDWEAGVAELEKQEQTLTVASAAEAAHRALKDVGLASELTLGDKSIQRIERQQNTLAQKANVNGLDAAVLQANAGLAHTKAEFLRQLATDRSQAMAQLQKLTFSVANLDHRINLAELRAPVSGVINSLAVRAAGQVVSAGTVLMTVVPANEPLIAEVWVRNEDAGFVYPGMPVQVKVSTFPFQKYGWLEGELTWVGADAEVPESMKNTQGEPLFFKARVKLPRQALSRDNKEYGLKAGMQVTADMQLGKRSLFEYLTSPLKKAVLEAARER